MTSADTDLFDEDLDDFDEARSAFVKMDDLEGRLLLVHPQDTGERESNLPGQAGKMYKYVITDVVVLDGEITEMIDEVPMVLDGFQLTGQTIVGQLEPKIRKGRKVLGRLTKKPAQQRGFSPAWVLADPTDEDKAKARAYLKAEAERRAKADPFD